MNRTTVLLRSFRQPTQVAQAVLVCEKTGVAIVATLNDMLRQTDEIDARATGHDWSVQCVRNKSTLTPTSLIRAASASVADLAIQPMQDVLGLGSGDRMNTPGDADGAWGWRFGWDQVAGWQAEFARVHGRWPGDPRRRGGGTGQVNALETSRL